MYVLLASREHMQHISLGEKGTGLSSLQDTEKDDSLEEEGRVVEAHDQSVQATVFDDAILVDTLPALLEAASRIMEGSASLTIFVQVMLYKLCQCEEGFQIENQIRGRRAPQSPRAVSSLRVSLLTN